MEYFFGFNVWCSNIDCKHLKNVSVLYFNLILCKIWSTWSEILKFPILKSFHFWVPFCIRHFWIFNNWKCFFCSQSFISFNSIISSSSRNKKVLTSFLEKSFFAKKRFKFTSMVCTTKIETFILKFNLWILLRLPPPSLSVK